MFWRKKKPVVERPAPPCGDSEHYYWTDDGWFCPACYSQRERRKAMEDRNSFAELVAEKIVKRLTSSNYGGKPQPAADKTL